MYPYTRHVNDKHDDVKHNHDTERPRDSHDGHYNKHNYELRWTALGVYIVSMNEIDTSVFLNRYALCIFESITSVVKAIATRLSI